LKVWKKLPEETIKIVGRESASDARNSGVSIVQLLLGLRRQKHERTKASILQIKRRVAFRSGKQKKDGFATCTNIGKEAKSTMYAEDEKGGAQDGLIEKSSKDAAQGGDNGFSSGNGLVGAITTKLHRAEPGSRWEK